MKEKLVIPCLDIKNNQVVKGINFQGIKEVGDPFSMAIQYEKDGADEIVLLDITASSEKRKSNLVDLIKELAKTIKIPITVGGGISTLNDIENILSCGANAVSINTAAIKNPNIVKEAEKEFGQLSLVVAIDAKLNKKDRTYYAAISGGKKFTDLKVIEWAEQLEDLGAGRILLTSVEQDGKQAGYDLEITRAVADKVGIPIIASGGAGKLSHFLDAIQKGHASAVLAASLFHYNKINIKDLKKYLKESNIDIRK